MTRFRTGDRVVLEGVIETIDTRPYSFPFFVRFAPVDASWVGDGPHITHAPAHDIGLLPEQIEAVTKERDDARHRLELEREQYARACAQLESLDAELKAARMECACMREERNEALADLVGVRASGRDTRILDVIGTLLGMRGDR